MSKSWKAFELRMAKALKGKRRGPDYRGQHSGNCDIIHPDLAPEVKLLSKVSWCDIQSAVKQAETNAGCQFPIVLIKKKGALDRDTLVVFRLETFLHEYRPEDPLEAA